MAAISMKNCKTPETTAATAVSAATAAAASAAAPAAASAVVWTASTVQSKFVPRVIEIVQSVATDTMHRMNGYKQDVKLLASGVFYGNEYYKALKQTNNPQRLKFLIDKGSFYHGYAPPKVFQMLPKADTPTGMLANCFVIKQGNTPSAALEALRKGITFTGCGETCQIGYWEGIKEVLGVEKFDLLFGPDSSTPLRMSFASIDNPINCLLFKSVPAQKFSRGQIYYISNSIQYTSKHINGESDAFISLCCDDTPGKEMFATLGLSPKGNTIDQVSEILRKEFNQPPFGMVAVTQEAAQKILSDWDPKDLKIVDQLKTLQVSEQRFKATGGGQVRSSYQINAERLAQLANASPAEARKLLDGWIAEMAPRKTAARSPTDLLSVLADAPPEKQSTQK